MHIEKFNYSSTNDGKSITKIVGASMKRARREKGLSGYEIAVKLNISQQQISIYERGINHISVDTLFNFILALDISYEILIQYILEEMKLSDIYILDINNASRNDFLVI